MEIRIKSVSKSNILDVQVLVYLWEKYIKELKEIDEKVDYTKEDVNELFRQKDTTIYLIIKDSMTSGFMVVGTPPKNCPKTCDYFVQDFYIQDKIQNKSVGKMAVKEFIKEHTGKYFLYVLIKNKRALHFWDRVIALNGCKKLEAEEEIYNYDNTVYIIFKTP